MTRLNVDEQFCEYTNSQRTTLRLLVSERDNNDFMFNDTRFAIIDNHTQIFNENKI